MHKKLNSKAYRAVLNKGLRTGYLVIPLTCVPPPPRLPHTTNQLPPTNCLQPCNCHQPIVTNQLPPTNCHQPIANHQLSAPVSGEAVNMWGYPVLWFVIPHLPGEACQILSELFSSPLLLFLASKLQQVADRSGHYRTSTTSTRSR